MDLYDAVFVGSGINSLAGAAILSKAGWKVCVLERNSWFGGAIRSAEITTPGFLHDLYSA
jgi:phytoene dehydrogenase-like protein